eukprot:NODE_912_length_1831_cov_25.893939_g804_i0.p1 GENE.NODE_912_length_1831_cov_25.893939_g804_i0~~NODE_912_length_1831_cov_25.893939_g804_i0.p1  ORF type:complete len:583 (+),score=145.20 NODE_912_length_1831_cov_25.893939_g804_i0:161-1750(+)
MANYSEHTGAVLVFLPGLQEISTLAELIQSHQDFSRSHRCTVQALHSSISSEEQQRVFQPARPGEWKIVIGTNIAETSITIDDVLYVIDSGKVKENRYDPATKLPQLVETWVSQASAKQRTGRAGRVQSGICFRLYTSYLHDKILPEFQQCEMLRVPLENLMLQIQALNLSGNLSYLSKAIEAPPQKSVDNSVSTLRTVGALDNGQNLTALGFHLANLPLDLRLGKMIIFSVLLGCVDPILSVAATMSFKSPFTSGMDDRDACQRIRRYFSRHTLSDHLCYFFVYNAWLHVREEGRKHESEFLEKYFLSRSALHQIRSTKKQFEQLLLEQGFITREDTKSKDGTWTFSTLGEDGEHYVFECGGKAHNLNSTNPNVLRACVTAGLYPNVAKIVPRRDKHPAFYTESDENAVLLHPSSVNFNQSRLHYPLLVFYERIKTSTVFLRDSTAISALSALLFCNEIAVDRQQMTLTLDNYIVLQYKDEEDAILGHNAKRELDRILRKKIDDPSSDVGQASKHVVMAIVRMLGEGL